MKSQIALSGLVLALLPIAALAAPTKVKPGPKTAKTAATYECTKCHMKVTAAAAKKDGYKDSMDGGTLVAVTTAKH